MYTILIFRFRDKVRSSITTKIKESWVGPRVGSVHWDTKLIQTLNDKNKFDDRSPVIFSGI